MNTADANQQLVARILLGSAAVFALLALLSATAVLPIDRGAHRLFAIAFGVCAAVDALIGSILYRRSRQI
jgi:hypothetical protein